MKIELELDARPQARPRFNSNGVAYEDAASKNYKSAVGYLAKNAMAGTPPFEKPCRVVLKFYRRYKVSSRRFGDCDNLAKAILDACNGILWLDDSQIISLTAEKYQSATAKIEIEVDEGTGKG